MSLWRQKQLVVLLGKSKIVSTECLLVWWSESQSLSPSSTWKRLSPNSILFQSLKEWKGLHVSFNSVNLRPSKYKFRNHIWVTRSEPATCFFWTLPLDSKDRSEPVGVANEKKICYATGSNADDTVNPNTFLPRRRIICRSWLIKSSPFLEWKMKLT